MSVCVCVCCDWTYLNIFKVWSSASLKLLAAGAEKAVD